MDWSRRHSVREPARKGLEVGFSRRSEIRSADELRAARRRLFDAFPRSPSCQELLEYQRLLIGELLGTERERKQSSDHFLRRHAHRVRLYADALAFTQLSVYAVRQLARSSGKPPSISSQEAAFDLTVQCCELANQNGVPALISDLTNILKTGDVVICIDEDAPRIFECKLSQRNGRFDRQGRRGRQLARIESVTQFLAEGTGKFFGDERERRTVVLKRPSIYDFAPVERAVTAALAHEPGTFLPSEWHLYSAALSGDTSENAAEVIARWRIRPGEGVAIGGAADPLDGAWPDVRPPILWDISQPAQWALMEGEVSLVHALRVEAFLGVRRGDITVTRSVEGLGDFAWAYELMVCGEPMVISPNVVYEVIYAHETIPSASDRLLEIAEAMLEHCTPGRVVGGMEEHELT